MKYQKVIETGRLTLRPFIAADAGQVAALAGDFRIAAMTLNIPHPYEPGMAAAWIATHEKRFNQNGSVVFAVTIQTGTLIGTVGLEPVAGTDSAELGYWIGVPYWNRGYCTEAARAALRYGFNDHGCARITAHHFAQNPASGRVMEKIGMRRQETVKNGGCKNGVPYDRVAYGIDAGEMHLMHRAHGGAAAPPQARAPRGFATSAA